MRAGALGSLASAAGLMVVAGASSAGAATACPAGATQVSPGVCSVTLTSSGSFTAPQGVTTLEALLVGGGGAGDADICGSYTGGAAGEVKYVSAISTTGPVAVTVGSGGIAPAGACGISTTSAINGGNSVLTDGASTVTTAAGGAGSAGVGGAGTSASAFVAGVPGTVALWPAIGGEPCFAQDGQDGAFTGGALSTDPAYFANVSSVLSCGAGALSDSVVDDPSGSGVFTNASASTGSGGSAYSYFQETAVGTWESDGGNGGSGFVTFRYPMAQVFEATLASTGPASTGLAWASAVLTMLGAVLLAASRRVRRPATV